MTPDPTFCGGPARCELLTGHDGDCCRDLQYPPASVNLEAVKAARSVKALAEALRRFRAAVPPRFRNVPALSELDLEPRIRTPIEHWTADVTAGKPSGALLLFGDVGSGKTTVAISVIRTVLLATDRPVRFTSIVDLLERLRPNGGGHLSDYTDPALLVLDDVGVERATEWASETTFALIDTRWNNQLATVITSNLLPSELRIAIGARCYDRLRDDALALTLPGPSRRSPSRSVA